MKTRVLSVSLAAALAGSLMLAQPAAALTFVDPVNLVQNTLTAIRTLEQINNQINQLQNEAQMLMNQARNLANLDFNIVNRLRSTLATTERLIAEAQGLATTCRAWMPRSRACTRSSTPPPSAATAWHRTHANAGRTP